MFQLLRYHHRRNENDIHRFLRRRINSRFLYHQLGYHPLYRHKDGHFRYFFYLYHCSDKIRYHRPADHYHRHQILHHLHHHQRENHRLRHRL
jgi:hypothetical protein